MPTKQIKRFISEFDEARRQKNISKANDAFNNMKIEYKYNILDNLLDYYQFADYISSDSQGETVLAIISAEYGFPIGRPPNDILSLVCDILLDNHTLFIKDKARQYIYKVIKLPSEYYLSNETKQMLYNKLIKIKNYKNCQDYEKIKKFLNAFDDFVYAYFNSFCIDYDNKALMASFTGQAIGDACGFIVEGLDSLDCEQYVENILKKGIVNKYGLILNSKLRYGRIEDYNDKIVFKFGQYTDDTQMARELIKSILRKGKFDPVDYGHAIVTLFHKAKLLENVNYSNILNDCGAIVGYGTRTLKSAQLISDGCDPRIAGSIGTGKMGNGSVMRSCQLGVLYYTCDRMMKKVCLEQSKMTHDSSTSNASCLVACKATQIALRCKKLNEKINANDMCLEISDFVKDIDKNVQQLLLDLPNIIINCEKENDEVEIKRKIVKSITDRCEKFGEKKYRGGNYIGFTAVQTVIYSLICFIRFSDSYMDTISMAISAGGDVDTVGAISGAISGAYLGYDKLPKDIIPYINDQGVKI